MKFALITLGLLFALSAQAENLYRCDIKIVDSKSNNQDRVIYLSHNRSSNISFSYFQTDLSLNLDADGKLSGTVNGQPNFILSGSVKGAMSFRSAFASGNIACAALGNVPAAFYFKPWKSIVVLGDKDLYLGIDKASDVSNYCYFGQTEAAKALLAAELNTSPTKLVVDRESGINVTTLEKRCVHSSGSYDDNQCLEWRTSEVTRALNSCDHNADNR